MVTTNIRGLMKDLHNQAEQNETTLTKVYIAYLLDGQDVMENMSDDNFNKAVIYANDLYIDNSEAGINCAIDYVLDILQNGKKLGSNRFWDGYKNWVENYGI